ncbi:hypothetical protein PtA15_1A252 [Puccinia triticina]|uniref:Uncharacterized protein n=1 Tax=Puccinia triticina TaxID=208348 RepID=A0ABY7C7G8_9BASI|nr:uncharacterized protein PtA15_1A252 [Puccinia triticina]WAQ80914.1 hypothetical protein PtA15_1A252 [Puccinia triticina]
MHSNEQENGKFPSSFKYYTFTVCAVYVTDLCAVRFTDSDYDVNVVDALRTLQF